METNTIKKADLIEKLAEVTGLSKKDSKATLETMLDYVAKNLKKGNVIDVAGFAKLEVKKRPAREGRNPATGEKIKIKASKKLKFTAKKALKESVL